jgi:general secretion pathway protein L
VSLLRIHGSLLGVPQRCQWSLVDDGREPVGGEGPLVELPRNAGAVQLVLPAAQVLITHARLPPSARRDAGSVLAFAVEEQTAGDPEANQVTWLGTSGDRDVLAVVDKAGLARWRDALNGVGVSGYSVHCESLLLPWTPGEWSLAWNGSEGFVRSGALEGAATDCGDRDVPPLALRLMLDEAAAANALPTAIALHTTTPGAAPDVEAWTRELGVDLRLAGHWDWRSAPPGAGVALTQERQRWRAFAGLPARLRPAGWMLAAALVIHAVALVIDWTSLASEQRALRQQMEARFRGTFPDAVAVADPALQMRRKLAEARHAAGESDSGDFLPMIEQVAAATKELPAGTVRTVSYEGGRLTISLSALDDASLRRIAMRLRQSGLSVDSPAIPDPAAPVVLTVHAS